MIASTGVGASMGVWGTGGGVFESATAIPITPPASRISPATSRQNGQVRPVDRRGSVRLRCHHPAAPRSRVPTALRISRVPYGVASPSREPTRTYPLTSPEIATKAKAHAAIAL